jgi:Ca2+-binding EF-hand superfamily protein
MLELAREQFDAASDDMGRLDVEQFGRVMAKLDLRGMPYERVFAAFAGHKPYIEADAFLAGLARLTEPSEARLRVIFDMYDAHHTGSIDSASLVRVLRASSTEDERLEAIKVERLAGILKEMDTEATGMVTFEQFHNAIRRDPFLAKLMLQPNLYFRRWIEASASDGLPSGSSSGGGHGRSWSRSHILEALRNGDMSDLVGSVLATVNIEDDSEDAASRDRNNWFRAAVLLLAILMLTHLVYSGVTSAFE